MLRYFGIVIGPEDAFMWLVNRDSEEEDVARLAGRGDSDLASAMLTVRRRKYEPMGTVSTPDESRFLSVHII